MIGYPFDSIVTFDEQGNPSYDRAVSSVPLKRLIGKLFTTGVMPNPSDNLQVFEGEEGMTVVVHAGFCVIEGGLKLEEANRTLEVQAADTTYDRIDTVVMRWNNNEDARICDLYILKGTASSNPVRPTLTQTASVYEIGLADIFVPRNVTSITQERITDTRMDASRCGIVSSISEFDTTTLYAQVQADLADFKSEEQAEFLAWFATIQNILDENVAAHLQNEIDALANTISHLCDVIEINIPVLSWVSNPDSNTNSEYPYIAINDDYLYADNDAPTWQMNGLGLIPTGTENDNIKLVREAVFNSTGVTLYASDMPSVPLILSVKCPTGERNTKIYLYKNGNEFLNRTGGWTTDGYTIGNGSIPFIAGTKNSNNMQIVSNASKRVILGMNNPVQCNRNTIICIEFEGEPLNNMVAYAKLLTGGKYVSYDQLRTGSVVAQATLTPTTSGTNILRYTRLGVDNFDLSNPLYLVFDSGTYTTKTATIKAVWLEQGA